MNLKLVKIASVREHMDAHYRGEISYSKAVDLINDDANKQLIIADVVGRSEQLKAFLSYIQESQADGETIVDNDKFVEGYLKSL